MASNVYTRQRSHCSQRSQGDLMFMFRISFLVLLFLAVSASATVLVYEGQGKGALPPTTSAFSKQPRLYAVSYTHLTLPTKRIV